MSSPDLSEFRELDELAELRKLNGELQRRLHRAKAKTADLIEAVREGAKEAALIVGTPPAVPRPPRDRRRRKPEVALLHLSDLHFGKRTQSFDSEVARRRLEQLADKVVRLAEIERADHPVPEAHVMLGGDVVENDGPIFPGQAWEVDSTLFEQLFAARSAIEHVIRVLLADFERVTVWETYGNHGRLGRRGDHPREDSADLLVYRLTRDRLEADVEAGRLVWHEAEGWYQIVEIGNYRALLVHGDQIRSFGGNVPHYGIARKVNAWASGVVEPFTDCYMGHFHNPIVTPLANGRGRVLVNPSIESDNQYAKEFVAATGTPGQRLNFIDPEKGRVTTERIIWLD